MHTPTPESTPMPTPAGDAPHAVRPLPARLAIFAYGSVCYAVFFATFLYAFAWIVGIAVPTTLDAPRSAPFWTALAVNLGLLTLFAVQHSVMARKWFKDRWTRLVPKPAERSTYTLFSSLALIALFALWRPMGGEIWSAEGPARWALYAVGAAGWGIVFFSTFLLNHFDLFGMRQVWLELRGRPYTPLRFRTPIFYRYVRHPLYVGWLLAFWGAPTMTVAHLLFAAATTAYILVAIRFEERDLVREHGDRYRRYRETTPMLVPGTKSRRPTPAAAPAVQPAYAEVNA